MLVGAGHHEAQGSLLPMLGVLIERKEREKERVMTINIITRKWGN